MNPPPFEPRKARRPFGLPTIDRLIAGELAKTLSAVLFVLVAIVVSRKFLAILARAIEGEVATETIFTLLGLKIVVTLAALLPASMFLSVLMVLGRMYRDNEMTVFACAGIGPMRIYRSILLFAGPVCVLGAFLSLQAMPWSERLSQELISQDEKGADVRGIKAGRFNEFSQGDVVLYAEELNTDKTMSKVFAQSRRGDETGIVIAESGHMEINDAGDHFVVLNNGRRYQGVPGRPDFVLSEFHAYGVRINPPEGSQAALKREAANSLHLWISGRPRELAELQRRLAVPLGTLALTLLAVPIARTSPRGGVWGNLIGAFLIYIVYENLQKISQGLLATGKLSLGLSYGGIYAVMLLATALLLARNTGWRWLRDTALGRR
ncbi:LPS export ABC transporter permease LptF [Methylococcus mesophilus]|uniref:LPS export ABC transporter permease LptF n=1 Tax=Methylococcus mesophilus TaxID=2993564 RepID=UPI00224AB726|nr:LPS export ABC transporter permease LptF [Methylococcus mesophilus]UZR28986.1 LPS export ABC transporter permease LptF [Methylococcus mesophilus]